VRGVDEMFVVFYTSFVGLSGMASQQMYVVTDGATRAILYLLAYLLTDSFNYLLAYFLTYLLHGAESFFRS
jgi:hypothetical protein